MKSLVQSMSGGNAQKLILARETASKPDVILASYPVRGLDIKATESIHKILVNEKNRGAGVFCWCRRTLTRSSSSATVLR